MDYILTSLTLIHKKVPSDHVSYQILALIDSFLNFLAQALYLLSFVFAVKSFHVFVLIIEVHI